ncbi:hypothetical protein WA158_001498 [Blastocystis sp. Blastoise]
MQIPWYWRTCFPLFIITFTCLSAIKKSLSIVSPYAISHNVITVNQYAYILSTQAIISAIGKFAGSNILVKVNLRRVFIIVSILIALSAICCSLIFHEGENTYPIIFIVWNLICLLNAFIWNSGSLITRFILPSSVQGTFWSFISSSGPFGALLDSFIATYILTNQSNLFLSLGILYCSSLPLLYYLYPSQSLTTISSKKDDEDSSKKPSISTSVYTSFLDLPFSLQVKFLFIGIACIFYFVGHKTLLNWGRLSISSISGYDSTYSHSITSYWEIGGILGTFLMGMLSDRFSSSIRLYMCLGAASFSLLLLSLLSVSMPISLYYIINFLLGLFIYIPESYIELIALESMPYSLTGVISGYCAILFQLGTFLSTVPVAKFIDYYGYENVHWVIFIGYLIATLSLYLSTWFNEKQNHEKQE